MSDLAKAPVPKGWSSSQGQSCILAFPSPGVTILQILQIPSCFPGERHPALLVRACLLETLCFQSNQI